MNRIDLIAAAVRLVADNTNLIRKPDTFEGFVTELFGGETYDRRMARNIEEESARAIAAVRRIRTNRKFKKIVEHV